MTTLEEQLKLACDEEIQFRKENSKYYKTATVRSYRNYISVTALYIINVCFLFWLLARNGKDLDMGHMIFILIAAFYPGSLVILIICSMFEGLSEYIIFKSLGLTKKGYQNFLSNEKSVGAKIWNLKSKIDDEQRAVKKYKEQVLIDQIQNLKRTVRNKEIKTTDAIEKLKSLRQQQIDIDKDGYHVKARKFFEDLFKEVEEQITTQDLPPDGPLKTGEKKITISDNPKVISTNTNNDFTKQGKSNQEINKLPTQIIKPSVPTIPEIKSAVVTNPKTEDEIELENRRRLALKAKSKFSRILQEAYLNQRLVDFTFLIKSRKCSPKITDYIYRLLKEECELFEATGFAIHDNQFYQNKLQEIRELIVNKVISPSTIEQSIPIPAQESAKPTKEILYENKSVEETFKGHKSSRSKPEEGTKAFRIIPKQDFEKSNKLKMDLGALGEEFVFEEQKEKLRKANREDLVPHVEWVSKDSDVWGYDIRSYTEQGDLIFIEVKTTTGGKDSTFYLTETELTQMNSLTNYYIYRVYDFNIEENIGSIFPVSKEQLPLFFNLEPLSYKVKLK